MSPMGVVQVSSPPFFLFTPEERQHLLFHFVSLCPAAAAACTTKTALVTPKCFLEA